jgi:hypothetical protein
MMTSIDSITHGGNEAHIDVIAATTPTATATAHIITHNTNQW